MALSKLIVKLYCWRQHLPTQWTWRSWTGVYLEPSPLWTSVHGTRKNSAGHKRGDINTSPAANPLIYKTVQPARHTGKTANQYLIWVKATLWDGTHTVWEVKNLKLDLTVTPNTTILLKECNNKGVLIKFCYSYRSVSCSAIIRKGSSCGRWEQTERPKPNNIQRVTNLEH